MYQSYSSLLQIPIRTLNIFRVRNYRISYPEKTICMSHGYTSYSRKFQFREWGTVRFGRVRFESWYPHSTTTSTGSRRYYSPFSFMWAHQYYNYFCRYWYYCPLKKDFLTAFPSKRSFAWKKYLQKLRFEASKLFAKLRSLFPKLL